MTRTNLISNNFSWLSETSYSLGRRERRRTEKEEKERKGMNEQGMRRKRKMEGPEGW